MAQLITPIYPYAVGVKLGNLSKWIKERGYPSRINNASLVQLQQFPQNASVIQSVDNA